MLHPLLRGRLPLSRDCLSSRAEWNSLQGHRYFYSKREASTEAVSDRSLLALICSRAVQAIDLLLMFTNPME